MTVELVIGIVIAAVVVGLFIGRAYQAYKHGTLTTFLQGAATEMQNSIKQIEEGIKVGAQVEAQVQAAAASASAIVDKLKKKDKTTNGKEN